MSTKKTTKKLFSKTFNKFRHGASTKNDAPPKSPCTLVPNSVIGVSESKVSDVEESEEFDAALVRLSLTSSDEIDHFSFDGDAEGDHDSCNASIFTDEGDDGPTEMWAQRYTPRTPREVAIGNRPKVNSGDNSSDEEDDMYLESDEEESENNEKKENEESNEEGGDTLMALPSLGGLRAASAMPVPLRGGGLTQSIIDYTSGLSMKGSLRKIDQIMDVSDESARIRLNDDESTDIGHEDGGAILAQLNTALSLRQLDQNSLQEVDELDSELENVERETGSLAQQLDASGNKNKSMEETLGSKNSRKIEEISERGEQVHMSRHFALQSMKITNLKLGESKKAVVPRIQSFKEEEDSEESQEDTGSMNVIEIIGENEESKGEIHKTNVSEKEQNEETRNTNAIETIEEEEDSEKESGDVGAVCEEEETDEREEDAELQRIVSVATGTSRYEERSEHFEKDFQKPCRFAVNVVGVLIDGIDDIRSNSNAMSPEDDAKVKRLRASMVRAKEMSDYGDQIREDPSYEVGDIEADCAPREHEFKVVHGDLRESSQLADMQMAEVIELRARLQEQQEQIEGLEHERNYNASKVSELMRLMKMSSTDDDIREMGEHLAHKSVEVAELNYEVDQLTQRLAQSECRSATLEAERDANKTVIVNLSESLWNDSSPKKASTNEDAAQALIKQGGLIPQNDAMEMTITSLQKKIECLEEERGDFIANVSGLTASLTELTQENEARMLKISALENQFLSLNQRQAGSSADTDISLNSPDSQNQEKLLRFKAWANNRINKAQEQYETIKDDMDNRRSNTNPDQILTS